MEKVVFPAWALLTVAASAVAGPHPNVLLVMVDDLRPALGCYGDTTAITPSIDALATLGVTFSKAYAQQALCGPSRSSLLTSRRPSSTGVVDVHRYWRHHGNYSTLPQHFREHGYYTASAGKIFHPGICSNFTDDAPYSWSGTPFHPSTQANKNDPVCGQYRNASDIVCPVTVEDLPEETLPDMQTTHYAISFLHRWKQLQKNGGPVRRATSQPCTGQSCLQPFFLAVGFHKPHIPLKYPRAFLDLYPLSRVPLPPNRRLPPRLPPVAFNPWNDLRRRHDIASFNLTFPYQPMPDDYARRIIQSYYAATSYTDLLIGDLLTVTERLFPDTVVALLGDHGWSLGEHQEWSKFSNYEVATKVPLILAGIRGYEKARRQLLVSSKTRRDGSSFINSGGATHTSRAFKSRCNDGSSKKKTTTSRCVDNSSNDSYRKDLPSDARRRYGKEEDVTQHKRKQIKLYLKIRRRLGRNFPKWRGFASKNDGGYETYWRFGEWFSSPKAGAEGVQERVRPGTEFSWYGGSSRERNRFRRRSGAYLPMRRNVTYDGIVELVDLFPTLADLAGLRKVPECLSKSDDENQNLTNVKDRTEVVLCTEGQSLSSLIIDNSNLKGVKRSTVNLNHGYHSHNKDHRLHTIQNSIDMKTSMKRTSPLSDNTLSVPLNTSGSIAAGPVNFIDSPHSYSSPSRPHPSPKRTLTMNAPTSRSNASFKAPGDSWIASKEERIGNHFNTRSLKQPPPPSYARCSASLSGGRVGISQYPRPSLTPSQDPDSDQPRLKETIVMGYSMRSLCYRYTLWVAFNSSAFQPDFGRVYGEELYDHRTDPGENRNVVWSLQQVALSAAKRLREELGRTLF